MKPTHTQETTTAANAPSWRQRIEEALSALKTAPPESGGFTGEGADRAGLRVRA